jgi:hypothetical protein
MDNIDYAEGINCPEEYDDEQMLHEFVIQEDHELYYLDSYLRETLGT